MDAARFDHLTRSLSTGSSRRATLVGLAAALGMLPFSLPALVEAGKRRRKKRKKKLQFNEFGCVNVGGKCRGKDSVCCSGICQGKKPRKGDKDKSRCVGHDESTCQVGQHNAFCGGSAIVPCTTTAGEEGACVTTTGNAAYCWNSGAASPVARMPTVNRSAGLRPPATRVRRCARRKAAPSAPGSVSAPSPNSARLITARA